MPLLIRESRRADFNRLWRIDQDCFPPGIAYTRIELAQYMAMPGTFTLIAEQEGSRSDRRPRLSDTGNFAGFIVAQRDRRGRGHIVTLDVVASARRSGVGTQLMAAAETRLRALGCDLIYLEAAVNNDSALAFYQRHGYSILKTLPRYYHAELDALLLAKKLPRSL